MLYPDGPDDPRARAAFLTWPHTHSQVARMTAFEAKAAGDIGEDNMRRLESNGLRSRAGQKASIIV
jgi:hypothetical protein